MSRKRALWCTVKKKESDRQYIVKSNGTHEKHFKYFFAFLFSKKTELNMFLYFMNLSPVLIFKEYNRHRV